MALACSKVRPLVAALGEVMRPVEVRKVAVVGTAMASAPAGAVANSVSGGW